MSECERALLRYAARRAADRPFFLASVLREYQELHGMDDDALARELNCTPVDLPRLGLCRCPGIDTPGPNPAAYRADIDRIAARFGLAPISLARIIREVDTVRKLRATDAPRDAGRFLAARDREPGSGDTPIAPDATE